MTRPGGSTDEAPFTDRPRTRRSRLCSRRLERDGAPAARAGSSSSAASCSPPARRPCSSRSRAATARALRAMLGQSQNQSFTIGPNTEILIWRKGIPAVGSYTDLKPGDWVNVNVRDRAGSSLADLEAKPAGIVGDRVQAERRAAAVALRRHRRRPAVGRPHRTARQRRQPPRAALAARSVGRPDLHLQRRHDLPALAGQGPERDRTRRS